MELEVESLSDADVLAPLQLSNARRLGHLDLESPCFFNLLGTQVLLTPTGIPDHLDADRVNSEVMELVVVDRELPLVRLDVGDRSDDRMSRLRRLDMKCDLKRCLSIEEKETLAGWEGRWSESRVGAKRDALGRHEHGRRSSVHLVVKRDPPRRRQKKRRVVGIANVVKRVRVDSRLGGVEREDGAAGDGAHGRRSNDRVTVDESTMFGDGVAGVERCLA